MWDLTITELLAFTLNLLVCGGLLIRCYFRRDPMSLWSPEFLVGGIYLYYVVTGPMIARYTGMFVDRGVDMRPYYSVAWLGAGIALLSWAAGYHLARVSRKPSPRAGMIWTDDTGLWRLGIILNIVGVVAYVISAGLGGFAVFGGKIDDPSLTESIYAGAFANYLLLAVNFLIAGSSVLLLARLRGRGSWLVLAGWVLLAIIIYLTMGFRYRLVLLAGGMTFIYYLHFRKRPNLVFFGVVISLFVVVMGVIGQTRTYGSGLDLSRRAQSVTDSFLSGFGETVVFATSGAVLEHVPGDRPFVWAEPLKQTLLMPVPSRFFPEKQTNAYMVETLMTIYGPVDYQGAAYMLFAETYQMFWWPGLVLVHFGLGWLCRWLWEWYRMREGDPLALVVYAAAIPYLYMVFSRGYLPQVVMLFFFSVGPAIVLYRWPKLVMNMTGGFRKNVDSRGVGRGEIGAGAYARIFPPTVPPSELPPPRRKRGQ